MIMINENVDANNYQDKSNYAIAPMQAWVFFIPYDESPYLKTHDENGLYLGDSAMTRNKKSGEDEERHRMIQVGKVVEVGPKCEHVKRHMDIFYMADTCKCIPIGDESIFAVPEKNILMVGDANIERYSEYEYLKDEKYGPIQ